MKNYLFVAMRDDDLIARFDIDNGLPENRSDFKIESGPAPMSFNHDKTRIFTGLRKTNELVCLRVGNDGALSVSARASLPSDPCFIGLDKSGEYVFTAYYRAGQVALHRWNEKEETLTEIQRIDTERMAHSAWLDPQNRFLYVPHTGPNKIYMFNFDKNSGMLQAQTPPWFSYEDELQPRHLCFHPGRDFFYAINEGSSTVSVFSYKRDTGAIEHKQTVSTLSGPPTEKNTCAEIRISPDGRYVYASNRGDNSICCFKIDDTSCLEFVSCTPSPAVPRSFDFSPNGRFLYAAGEVSGELACYEVDQNTGRIKEISRKNIGNGPLWVMSAVI